MGTGGDSSGCCTGLAFLFGRHEAKGGMHKAYHRSSTRLILPNTNPQQLLDVYCISCDVLGAGAFGSVSRVTVRRSGTERAMKTINKAGIPNIQAFQNELNIQADLDHPNIVRVFDSFEDKTHVFIVMEACGGGDVSELLEEKARFTELEACVLIKQVMQAVFYIHNRSIAHRDLKLENFLLKNKGVPLQANTLKLIDFGMAQTFVPGKQSLNTKCGTLYYTAPDIFRGPYDEKCDIWSCGVALYILLSGRPPFQGESDEEIIRQASKASLKFDGAIWQSVTPLAKLLIVQMCKLKPEHRFNAEQVISSLWMKAVASSLVPSKSVNFEAGDVINGFKQFEQMSGFQKAAMYLVAHSSDDHNIMQLREQFGILDSNCDGMITIEELKAGCGEAGIELENCDGLFASVDTDGSGCVDYTEFISAMMGRRQFLLEQACWDAFRVIDRDGDGHISLDELRQVLNTFGTKSKDARDQAWTALKAADLNGDGVIDFAEFVAMLRGGPAAAA